MVVCGVSRVSSGKRMAIVSSSVKARVEIMFRTSRGSVIKVVLGSGVGMVVDC